jgi:hypothetical protein
MRCATCGARPRRDIDAGERRRHETTHALARALNASAGTCASTANEVLADLPGQDRVYGGGQRLPQHTEKARGRHQDQPVELVLPVPRLDLGGDSAGEELGLLPPRPPLAARTVVRGGAAPAGETIGPCPGTRRHA